MDAAPTQDLLPYARLAQQPQQRYNAQQLEEKIAQFMLFGPRKAGLTVGGSKLPSLPERKMRFEFPKMAKYGAKYPSNLMHSFRLEIR